MVPELTIWGVGNIHESQAHLLLGRWKLGLEVPSCLLCLSWSLGTLARAKHTFSQCFSGAGHFLPDAEDMDASCPLPFVTGYNTVQKRFYLISQAIFWKAGPRVSTALHCPLKT